MTMGVYYDVCVAHITCNYSLLVRKKRKESIEIFTTGVHKTFISMIMKEMEIYYVTIDNTKYPSFLLTTAIVHFPTTDFDSDF